MPRRNSARINRIENNSIIKEYDNDYILYYDGSYYKGELKEIENSDCIRHGYGVMTYADGKSSYNGYYKDNLKHGIGKYVSRDGSSYEGEYIKGFRCGKGKYISQNENKSFIYEGEWENDLKHGNGKYLYKEKYNNDILDYNNSNNNLEFYEEEFEGTWVNDEKNGKGELRIKGVWNDGNLISSNEIKKCENIEEYIQYKINKNNNNQSYDWCQESYHNMFPPGEVYEF